MADNISDHPFRPTARQDRVPTRRSSSRSLRRVSMTMARNQSDLSGQTEVAPSDEPVIQEKSALPKIAPAGLVHDLDANSTTMPTYKGPRGSSLITQLERLKKYQPRRQDTDLEDYFTGPRRLDRHSKWPMVMRLHGSVLPKLIIPLCIVAGWATAISVIHRSHPQIGISNVLLTVLGFVVGLSLSFRNATAYERYAEGRKFWQMLSQVSNTLGRTIWVHVRERETCEIDDLLEKISAINLISAFAYSLMHKLRFEPYTDYKDLVYLVDHLDTLARTATKNNPEDDKSQLVRRKTIRYKILNALHNVGGEYLGLPFVEENPRKLLKKARMPLGNLPLEILNYISTYIDFIISEGTLTVPGFQIHAANSLLTFNEVLAGCERILSTPLPLAYSIAIAQITWLYILILPFQLVNLLGWITIPGTIMAGAIILGLLYIGQEIENPFGNDVNDLPLLQFCDQIQKDLEVITSHVPRHTEPYFPEEEERSESEITTPVTQTESPKSSKSSDSEKEKKKKKKKSKKDKESGGDEEKIDKSEEGGKKHKKKDHDHLSPDDAIPHDESEENENEEEESSQEDSKPREGKDRFPLPPDMLHFFRSNKNRVFYLSDPYPYTFWRNSTRESIYDTLRLRTVSSIAPKDVSLSANRLLASAPVSAARSRPQSVGPDQRLNTMA